MGLFSHSSLNMLSFLSPWRQTRIRGAWSPIAQKTTSSISAVSTLSDIFDGHLPLLIFTLCGAIAQLDEDLVVSRADCAAEELFRGKGSIVCSHVSNLVAPQNVQAVQRAIARTKAGTPQLIEVTLLVDGSGSTPKAKLLVVPADADGRALWIGFRTQEVHRLCLPHNVADASDGLMDSAPLFTSRSTSACAGDGVEGGTRSASSASLSRSAGVLSWMRRRSAPTSTDASLAYSQSHGTSSLLSPAWRTMGRSPLAKKTAGVVSRDAQTERVLTADTGAQTEATHLPDTRHVNQSSRPPLKPCARHPPKPSRPMKRNGSMKSGGEKVQALGDVEHPSSAEPSRPSSPARQNSTVSGFAAQPAICHFQATPEFTATFTLKEAMPHINAPRASCSCCLWHATASYLSEALTRLTECPCKAHAGWMPLSGWQCQECRGLNDVDTEECQICYADRMEPG